MPLPIILSAIAKDNYTLNLGLKSLVFTSRVICMLLLPELGSKTRKDESSSGIMSNNSKGGF